jgi:DNA polymerase elongation subunit (family B)
MTRKRLFFDIETSPNIVTSWRIGYNLNISPDNIINERAIICVCWKWEGEDEVHSLTWDKNQNDKTLLKKFIKVLNSADEVIGHNSDRFDIKWLRTRCIFHEIDMFPTYRTIDTLKYAKSGFYFNSNKLDYISKFLGVGAKSDTGGFQTWKDILFNKSEKALDHMVEYCKNDVVILEKVYDKLRPYSKHKVNYATLRGGDRWNCPNCGTEDVRLSKTYTTSAGTIMHSLGCKAGCRSAYSVNNKVYMDWLKYKMINNI